MASKKLEWDNVGERLYETGVFECALYPSSSGTYPKGVAWNGLTKVANKPTGAESTALYANNAKYGNLISNEDFEGSIEAYMAPDEFAECDGSIEVLPGVQIGQQKRIAFGLAYKSNIGNDTEGENYGYYLHLVYGATASPSEEEHSTINDSPEVNTLSWDFKTTPVSADGYKPTAHLRINSTKVDTEKLAALEKILYGSEEADARLPLPNEVFTILGKVSTASYLTD